MITVPAPAGISQPEVPGREFSRCTGLAAVEELAGAVEDVLLLLEPPHALTTTAMIVAPMAKNDLSGMRQSLRSILAVQHSEEKDAPSRIDLP